METSQIDISKEHLALITELAKTMQSDEFEVHYCFMEIAIAVLKFLNEPDEKIKEIFSEIKQNKETMEMAGLIDQWLKIEG